MSASSIYPLCYNPRHKRPIFYPHIGRSYGSASRAYF